MFSNFMENYDTPSEVSDSLFELVPEEDRKKYVCKHTGCGKVFRYKSEIMRHIATHSESRPFICQYDNCYKSFKRSDALENHVRSSHTKETPFACPFEDCGMKFTTHGSFRYHVLKHNKQLPEGESFTPTKESAPLPEPRKQVKLSSPTETPVSVIQELPSKQKLGKGDFDDIFFAPPPRFAGKIQWEMANDESEVPSETNKSDDSQNEKYNIVMEENNLLKQKLSTSEKVIKSMQKQINDLLSNLFAYQSQYEPLPQNMAFPDFDISKDTFGQETSPETGSKSEDPLLDIINYSEDMNPASPSQQPIFKRENSFADAFLSFGNAFEF